MKHLLSLSLLSLAAAEIASAQVTIFRDEYTRGGPLLGSSPTVVNSGSWNYDVFQIGTNLVNGALEGTNTVWNLQSSSAFMQPGNVYRLSYEILSLTGPDNSAFGVTIRERGNGGGYGVNPGTFFHLVNADGISAKSIAYAGDSNTNTHTAQLSPSAPVNRLVELVFDTSAGLGATVFSVNVDGQSAGPSFITDVTGVDDIAFSPLQGPTSALARMDNLELTVQPVPEPAAALLGGLGLLGLLKRRR